MDLASHEKSDIPGQGGDRDLASRRTTLVWSELGLKVKWLLYLILSA